MILACDQEMCPDSHLFHLNSIQPELPLKHNIVQVALANWVVYFLQFLTTIIVSRILTPHEAGIFTVSLALTMVLQGLREFGLVTYIVQARAITDDHLKTVFGLLLIGGVTSAAVVFLSKHYLAVQYNDAALSDVLTILSVSFLLFPLGLPTTALLRRQLRFNSLGLISILAAFASFTITVLLAFTGFGPLAPAYGTLAGSVVQIVVALAIMPQHIFLAPSLALWREIALFGSKASAAVIVMRFTQGLPELLIGRQLSLGEAAMFSRGRAIVTLMDRLVMVPITQASMPDMAEQLRLGNTSDSRMLRLLNYSLLISWSALAILFCNAEFIIYLLYGHQWLEAAPVLKALCLYQAFYFAISAARTKLQSQGHVGTILLLELLLAFLVGGAVLIGSQFGMNAVAMALPVPSFLAACCYLYSLNFFTREHFRPLLLSLCVPTFCATVILVLLSSVDYVFGLYFTSVSLLAQSTLAIANASLGVLIFVIVCLTTKHPILAIGLSVLNGLIRYWRKSMHRNGRST